MPQRVDRLLGRAWPAPSAFWHAVWTVSPGPTSRRHVRTYSRISSSPLPPSVDGVPAKVDTHVVDVATMPMPATQHLRPRKSSRISLEAPLFQGLSPLLYLPNLLLPCLVDHPSRSRPMISFLFGKLGARHDRVRGHVYHSYPGSSFLARNPGRNPGPLASRIRTDAS